MAMGFSSSSSRAQHHVAWALLLLYLCLQSCRVHGGSSRKLYIVYLGDVKHGHPDGVVASHHDMLTTLLGSKEESSASVVYNYKHGFSGFAAMLTADQARQLEDYPEVIGVQPSKRHTTATTRSWDFLELNYQKPTTGSGLLSGSKYGEDVSIGLVDTGIWPESRSFSDEGYGPIPSRLNGKCLVGQDWGINNCSRKIIDAQFYNARISDQSLKFDSMATAHTPAGYAVEGASFHSLAEGVTREDKILKYRADAGSSVAKIEPACTVMGKEILAPKVAPFSSIGPTCDCPDIIKPDIAASGANILAAAGNSSVFISGTSMAAHHVRVSSHC